MKSNPFVFTALTPDDEEYLMALRAAMIVALERSGYYGIRLPPTVDALVFLQGRWDEGVFDPSDPNDVDAVAVVLGDVLAAQLGLHWTMVSGPYGTYPTLRYRQTSIQVTALQMIAKRVDEGRDVNLTELYEGVRHQVSDMVNSGNYK